MSNRRLFKNHLAFYFLLLLALFLSSPRGAVRDVALAQADGGVDPSAVLAGAGTAANPFQIWWCEDLQAIEHDLGADYILVQDINCAGGVGDGQGFSPVGDNSNPFTGSLDGAGHTISGLVIDRPSDDWVGLFGVTQGAHIKQIGIQDVFVRGRNRVGGIVGWQRDGVIEECFATGAVVGEQYVGGIAGRTQDASIINSYARIAVSCTAWDSKANKTNANCGGIIGGVVQGFTYNSYAAGEFAAQHGATGGGGPESLVASFFDCDLTGGCGNSHPEGQSTATLQDLVFYESEGWDFSNVWGFSAQALHPCLQWQTGCSGGSGCGLDDPDCDGVDDDCDGVIDEDFPSSPTTCGVGACSATGATRCDGGQVVDTCAPGAPAADDTTCDALDDDCDGLADEDFASVETTCGVGACAGVGATICVDGAVEDSCVAGEGAPNDPTCDGGDDDCDGSIDEDYESQATSCGVGACAATGVTSCVGGVEQDSCVPGTPALEDVTCNGVDDNCDGTVDSDFLPSSTTCGVGACSATGTQTCVDGQLEDDCQPGTPAPNDSICDAIDEDCDGAIDEDVPVEATTCGVGICASTGVRSCSGGVLSDDCVPGAPAASDPLCDGVDEDCDGQVDEDYVALPTSCGLGLCAASGVTSCVGGVESNSCTPGTPIAGPDTCNGLDDDCDGTADEDFVPTMTSCGVGACASSGSLYCVAGNVVDDCAPGVPAATDDPTCDGIDDDCDGTVDEDCVTCIPATCQDYGINCGTVVESVCGTTIDCGTCQDGETCGGGGVANVCGSGLPPDPEDIAPDTDAGGGSFYQSFSFLVDGPTPVQSGVEPGAIEPARAAILRGHVVNTTGQPLSGVQVFVPREPSLGQTSTRVDGEYDIVVNGGGLVTLQFESVGFLPVQRTVLVPWENVVDIGDVAMTVASDVATAIGFGSSSPQVAESRPVTDADGTRQITAYFPAGTEAVAELDGQSVPLTSGTLRMTEYTVGDSGPLAMPAQLPENSLYTFAADLSFDEVGPTDRVTFNQTTYFYLNDFLGLPAGAVVPNGYYDYDLSDWVPESDGLVMTVVGVSADGLAEIDATYEAPEDGTPSSPADLALIGVTDDERRVIAQKYAVGESFWRMPIDHLSPYDWNFNDVEEDPPPPDPPPRDDQAEPEDSDCDKGSIVYCQSRTLGERIPIAGTPFALYYNSGSADANTVARRTVVVPFPEEVPSSVVSIAFRASVLGRVLADEILPLSTESYVVEWDGRDAYGRDWLGSATLEYSFRFVRSPTYQAALRGSISPDEAASFGVPVCLLGDPCCGRPAGGPGIDPVGAADVPARPGSGARPDFEGTVQLAAASQSQFGGWSLSHYHRYDREAKKLLRGDGTVVRKGSDLPSILTGRTSDLDRSNDVATTVDEFNDTTQPEHIAVGPDGWVYFKQRSSGVIWRARQGDGIERLINFICGDARDLAVDRNGDVYAACGGRGISRITEVAPGVWERETVYGGSTNSLEDAWEDGDPLAGKFLVVTSLTFRDDGRLFFALADGSVRSLIEVLPDGTGRIVRGDLWDRIDAGSDNTIIALDISRDRVIRIFPDSSEEELADFWVDYPNTRKPRVGYEWESVEEFGIGSTSFPQMFDLVGLPNGSVYVNYRGLGLYEIYRGLIRRVSLDGMPQDFTFPVSSSVANQLENNPGGLPEFMAVGPGGALYMTDVNLHRIYAYQNLGNDVVSSSGDEIYQFSGDGLHERTLDADTGTTLWSFTHDADGKLVSIADLSGRTTTLERPDTSTIRLVAPPGPGGTRGVSTTLRLNDDGRLEELQDPRGAQWAFDYGAPGLLTKLWDPRANAQGLRSGAPYTFEYERFDEGPDARWLLKRDLDPVGGEQTLENTQSRTVEPIFGEWCDGSQYIQGYSVKDTTSTITKTTKLGRQTTFETRLTQGSPRDVGSEGAVEGVVTTTLTNPDGWTESRTDPDSRGTATTSWPGGSRTATVVADSRLGTSASYVQASTLRLEPLDGAEPRDALEFTVEQTRDWERASLSPGLPIPDSETVTITVTPQAGEPRTSTLRYDRPTRSRTVTTGENRVRTTVLDEQSRVLEKRQPGQVPTVYDYGADGYLRSITRTKGAQVRKIEIGYDTQGYISSMKAKVSDAENQEIVQSNDPGGFALATDVPGVSSVSRVPDLTGSLSELSPPGKPNHRLSYTPLGQYAQYASPAGTLSTDGTCPAGTQCWGYSLDREVRAITLPDGSAVTYQRNPARGTLDSIDVPASGTTTFGYDDVGRRESATAPTGGTMRFAWQSNLPISTAWQGTHTVTDGAQTVWSGSLDGKVELIYNDFLEISQLRVSGGASLSFERDRDGLPQSVEIDGPAPALILQRSTVDGHVEGTTLGAVATTNTLDVSETTPGFGDLLAVSAVSGATDLYDASYTHDDRGRIRTWTESVQGEAAITREFQYDGAGRLTTVLDVTAGEPGVVLEEYAFDGNGNRMKAVSSYPGAVPSNAELGTNLGCDGPAGTTATNDQDQLCRYGDFEYRYNARGQLEERERVADGTVTLFAYDGLGRLKRVGEPGMDVRYVHDALGRRIGKVRDGNLEKGWLYQDGLNPIAQLDGNGNVESTFVYGTRSQVPDAMVMADGTTYRLITDHLGSVRLVVNAADGSVVQRIDYDAAGRVLRDTNPGFQPFGFAGGLYDDDTGLVRFGARDYDAYSGRWTAKDPILFDGEDSNLYAYASNDPVNLVDPTGFICWRAVSDAFTEGFTDNFDAIGEFFSDEQYFRATAAALGLPTGAFLSSEGYTTFLGAARQIWGYATTTGASWGQLGQLGVEFTSQALTNLALRISVVGAAFLGGLTAGSALVGYWEAQQEFFEQLASETEDCSECE